MKTRVLLLLAAMGLLAGCSREPMDHSQDSLTGGKTVIQVGISPDTRTYMGDKDAQNHRKMYWSEGDQIAINGVTSEALPEMAEPRQSASFTFNALLSTPYNVVYPASIYTDETHVTLPAVQTYKAGGFADGMFPMAGYAAADGTIGLSSLCAMVKVSVLQAASDADTHNIASVRFMGRGDEQVSGLFTIDYQNATLTGASTGEADREVGVEENLATSTSTPVEYFLVIPAGTYEDGFDLLVKDAEGHTMTQSKTGSVTLEAGHLYTLPAFEFIPTATVLDIEIGSAAGLIQFAQNFNAGVYPNSGKGMTVTLTADITFSATESASFNTTGGIGNKTGDTSNYFNGTFNGNGHKIIALDAQVPVFAYTDSDAVITDLTLDGCALTVAASDETALHAPLVGRNKGLVEDCVSNTNVFIENIQNVATASQHYGALVARNYGGTIKDCTVSGDISCLQSGVTVVADNETAAANAIYVGGVSGTNADNGDIRNTDFTGHISISSGEFGGISATYEYGEKSGGLYFYVGGIVGYADSGIISTCNTASADKPTTFEVRGIFVPAIGGIVGWYKTAANSEITNCNNYASLLFESNGARAKTTPCRVGGIAGRSIAPISNCQNYGAIKTTGNSTSIYLGGIAGEGANVSYCTNNPGGTVTRSSQIFTAQTNRYIFIGGILGDNLDACVVDHCDNAADIISNQLGASTATTLDMGGIVGAGNKQIDISNCNNSGMVKLNDETTNVIFPRITNGGILGYGPIANTTITSCNNSGQIYCNMKAKKDGRSAYTGGIAGMMGTSDAGVAGLEISSCTNTGEILPYNYSTTTKALASMQLGGCIVGVIQGTADSKASIHDCKAEGNRMYIYRGIAGGIAGYANNSSLSDNTVSNLVSGNDKVEMTGGIVGWMVNSTLTGCTFSGSMDRVKEIGGLVGYMDSGSITNCKVNGATITKGTNAAAVLVSNAASGTTISNCGIKGTLDGAAITLDSNMITTNGGATVTGTYLLP